MDDRDFDEDYFENCCGRPYQRDDVWVAFFDHIANAIVEHIRPRHVLDAGCAMGFLVEALRRRGIKAYGFDISSYAIKKVSPWVKNFCWQSKVSDELEGHFDLIICQEVFPHVPLEAAEAAIGNFCRHSDNVLFSCCPDYPPDPRHVNLQPPEHWEKVFSQYRFHPDHSFDASFMTPWAIRFKKASVTTQQSFSTSFPDSILSIKKKKKAYTSHIKNMKVKDFMFLLKHKFKKIFISLIKKKG